MKLKDMLFVDDHHERLGPIGADESYTGDESYCCCTETDRACLVNDAEYYALSGVYHGDRDWVGLINSAHAVLRRLARERIPIP